jgi:GTP-binding protein
VFIDSVTIRVAGGRGGDGCVSMRREKYVPRGGPDGGNGGRGGSVYLEATLGGTTLLDFRYRRDYAAGNGAAGGGQRRTGADGEDIVIAIPCGTAVYDHEAGVLLGDLVAAGDHVLVARGGRGGRGNWEFRSARNQAPRRATPGRPGERREIRLELKLIADVGLVGAPNAGKSTLLARLTAARPRIADYPFTTLVPNLGIVDLGDWKSCTLADIPGLVAGAAEGKGLGHDFLRHVERTRSLLLLVDVAAGAWIEACTMLRGELGRYGRGLVERPFAVVLTKADLVDAETTAIGQRAVAEWGREHGAAATLALSAATGSGLAELRRFLRGWPGPPPQETASAEPPA